MSDDMRFYQNVKHFYGRGGIYRYNIANYILYTACCLVAQRKDHPFTGGSMDRFKVKEILESIGYLAEK